MSLEEFFSDNPDLIHGEYIVNEEAKREYVEAATMLTGLLFQGKFTMQLDDPEKPYYIHAIRLVWNDEEWEGVEAKPISEVLKRFGRLIVDGNIWQLTRQIYKQ